MTSRIRYISVHLTFGTTSVVSNVTLMQKSLQPEYMVHDSAAAVLAVPEDISCAVLVPPIGGDGHPHQNDCTTSYTIFSLISNPALEAIPVHFVPRT